MDASPGGLEREAHLRRCSRGECDPLECAERAERTGIAAERQVDVELRQLGTGTRADVLDLDDERVAFEPRRGWLYVADSSNNRVIALTVPKISPRPLVAPRPLAPVPAQKAR